MIERVEDIVAPAIDWHVGADRVFVPVTSSGMLLLDSVYQLDPIDGLFCRLILRLWSDSDGKGIELRYGSLSGGLPDEVPRCVSGAIEATESWYQAQRRVAGKQ